MRSIDFDTGMREYAINGDNSNVLRLCISDLSIGKRVQDMLAELEKLQEKYGSEAPSPETVAGLDTEIRRLLDTAFGAEISARAFGVTNCCSPLADGRMLVTAFLEAFLPVFEEDLKEFAAAGRARTEKYLSDLPEG